MPGALEFQAKLTLSLNFSIIRLKLLDRPPSSPVRHSPSKILAIAGSALSTVRL